MDRRNFLKTGAVILVGSSSAYGLRILTAPPSQASSVGPGEVQGKRWGMLIDLRKCREDCTACVDACREENNTGMYGDNRYDIYWIRKVTIESKDPASTTKQSLPLLCNHCDDPPCALVCPVQATYKREDGIVIVDQHRCIGCRYCMIACPYNARFFNYQDNHEWPNKKYPKRSHGVAESCNLCAHLLDKGEQPACMVACQSQGGAIVVGDLNDPDSEISRLIDTNPVKGLRENLGTEPKVFYVGLPSR
jgi:molybdopterin-containing oxidoreductase family iron-sulfur binding subunit